MQSVITVENIGKKYTINHKNSETYDTLRDSVTRGAKGLTKKLIGRNNKTGSKEEFWALRDVSFNIKKGERVGIIGPNGAGKSTLLKILSRITEPTTGKITLQGRVASLLEVGTGFHPELTGRENIFLNGAILGMSKSEIENKFSEIVSFAEVEKFIDTPVKRYSSGMYVRLAFAVAAHLEPEILIIDEVLAVGDAKFQKKCLGKMREISKGGRTVLFVSHNMAAIQSLCDRTILLKNGSVAAFGKTSEVIEKYAKEFSETVTKKSWGQKEGPNNKSIALAAVELAGEGSQTSLTTDSNLTVTISFESLADNATLGMTLILYSETGECIFSSINNQSEWYGKPLPKGKYVSTCLIPGQLLNQGRYRVDLVLFEKGFTESIVVPEILHFEVQDGPSLRKDFFGSFAGIIRPKLIWKNMESKQEKNV